MAVAKISSIMALLPPTMIDPCSTDVQRQRNILMLHLRELPNKYVKAWTYLAFYRHTLSTTTLEELLAMFPEKEFTPLSMIEYLLNHVRTVMDGSAHACDTRIQGLMEFWKNTIAAVEANLRDSFLLDEEQALRVKACYKDIAKCFFYSTNEGNYDDESDNESSPVAAEPWSPSMNDTYFMAELKKIHASAVELPTMEMLVSLYDLCKSVDLLHATRSEIETDTALRLIMSVVDIALVENCCDELNLERYTFLLSSVAELNTSWVFSNNVIPVPFQRIVINRQIRVQALLQRAHDVFNDPSESSKISHWSYCKTVQKPITTLPVVSTQIQMHDGLPLIYRLHRLKLSEAAFNKDKINNNLGEVCNTGQC